MQGQTDEEVLWASEDSSEQASSEVCSNPKEREWAHHRLAKATLADHMLIPS